jgi:hypothetical protein
VTGTTEIKIANVGPVLDRQLHQVDASAMPLLTQAEYARRHRVSRQAIHRQVREGIIPTHGPRKRIDPVEADRCWVPRIDAGMPQLRLPRATERPVEDDPVAAWRSRAADAACAIAEALGADENQVLAVLDEQLEARIAALGWLEDGA